MKRETLAVQKKKSFHFFVLGQKRPQLNTSLITLLIDRKFTFLMSFLLQEDEDNGLHQCGWIMGFLGTSNQGSITDVLFFFHSQLQRCHKFSLQEETFLHSLYYFFGS